MLLQLTTHAAAVADPEFARELLTLGFLFRSAIAGGTFLVWRIAAGPDGFRPHLLERVGGAVLLLEGLHGWIALITAQSIGAVAAIRWFSFVPMQCAFVALALGHVLRARRDAPDGQLSGPALFMASALFAQVLFMSFWR